MQQQDQQLINNLIQQQNSSAYAQEVAHEIQSNITENQMSVSRVVTAKYKVYVIIFLILIAVIGLNFGPQAWKDFNSAQAAFQDGQATITKLDNELSQIGENKKLWKMTENDQNQIIECINKANNEDCDALNPSIRDHLNVARAYLQLGNLKADKMEIDEKKILKNLDQYLIRQDPSENSSPRNGEILSIEI